MPMDGCVVITVVLDIHQDLGALRHAQGWAGDRAVVAQHPHGVLTDLLGNRLDAHLEHLAISELDQFGRPGGWKSRGVGGERLCFDRFGVDVLLHLSLLVWRWRAPAVRTPRVR